MGVSSTTKHKVLKFDIAMMNKTMVGMLEESIINNWTISAFANYGKAPISYEEVGFEILRLHQIFESCKIKPGDKIILLGKNSMNWALVYLATISYGAVIVPLLPEFLPRDVQNLINHSDANAMFISDSIYQTLNITETPKLNSVFSLSDFSVYIDQKGYAGRAMERYSREAFKKNSNISRQNFALPKIKNSELLCISYTSGTSGVSKGVMLTHNSLAANVDFARRVLPLKSGDTVLSFLPLAHSFESASV